MTTAAAAASASAASSRVRGGFLVSLLLLMPLVGVLVVIGETPSIGGLGKEEQCHGQDQEDHTHDHAHDDADRVGGKGAVVVRF